MAQGGKICEVNSSSLEPNVEITDIQWHHQQEVIFTSAVVDTSSNINNDLHPKEKDVNFLWSTKDSEKQSTTWSEQLNINKKFECEVTLPDSGCNLKIAYDNAQNIATTSASLSLRKSQKVIVHPKTTAIAKLVMQVSDVVELPFTATIKCIGVNGMFSEHKVEGTWRGTLYNLSSSHITVEETELGIM